MITLLILILISLFILGIFFLPIRIVINTRKNEYFISLPGYIRADLLLAADYRFSIKIKVLFFSFRVEPNRKKNYPQNKINSYSDNNKLMKGKSGRKNSWLLVKNLISGFRIKRFHASIDTGDFPLNAQLIPVAQIVSRGNVDVTINFENRNVIDIYIITKIYKLLAIAIKHKLYNK